MSSGEDTSFARLVSLACHDLRTPLATVSGFARTLTRMGDLGDPVARYLELIENASDQLTEVLDVLTLLARIEGGRYEPVLLDVDTRELADALAARFEGEVEATGGGGPARADRPAADIALHGLARGAIRHGGTEPFVVTAEGVELSLEPVAADAAPIVRGELVRDLGAVVGWRVLEAQGAKVELVGERLVVRLPAAT